MNGYTFQDLLALNRVTAKLYRRIRTVIYRVVMLLLGLIFLGTGALFLWVDGPTVWGVALILLSPLYLGLAVF